MSSSMAVWLIPTAQEQPWLCELIQALADRYGAPVFEPHVTVYGGIYTQADDLEVLINRLAQSTGAFPLTIQSLDYTADLFKTVFISFKENATLTALGEAVRQNLQVPQPYALQPHLSLIYKEMAAEQKQAIIASLVIEQGAIAFDQLQIVTPSSGDWRDFASWQVLYHQRLGVN